MDKETKYEITNDELIEFECQQALNMQNANVSDHKQASEMIKKSKGQKKKQKLRKKKQQSRKALRQIIKDMCIYKSNFKQRHNDIDSLLNIDMDQDRFYEFISKVTKEEMDIFAKQIHLLTRGLCEQCKQQGGKKSVKIVRLFQLIETVKHSSIQIEEVINLFIRKSQSNNDENYFHKNLECSTLKYIVNADPYKEDFEKFCIQFLRYQRGDKERQAQLIKEIYSEFQKAQYFCESAEEEEDPEEAMYSDRTRQQEEEYEQEDFVEQQQKKKKKKKKKKNKREEMRQKQQQQCLRVRQYILKISINKECRSPCYIEEGWIEKLRSQLLQGNKHKKQRV